MKPRVYWCYYPKLKRGFWRVSMMPKHWSADDYKRWMQAHAVVRNENQKLVREDSNADQVTREMRRQSH